MPENCKFDFIIKNDPEVFYERIKNLIENEGGYIRGDKNSGVIQITKRFVLVIKATITANYSISNNIIYIDVTEKPRMISCADIQNEVQKKIDSIDNLT